MRFRAPSALLVACALGASGLAACSAGDDDAAPVPSTAPGGSGEPAAPGDQPAQHPLDDTLRLHHVQVLGSHNSYHAAPYPELLDAIRGVDPAQALALEYAHRPLREQLEALGIRQFELDVFADPEGGAYASPELASSLGVDLDDDARLAEPGFKVLHVEEFDPRSTCPTLVSCIEEIDGWSREHPGHVPIVVLIEVKVPHAGAAVLDEIDAEIRSVLPPERLVTPDDVRGDHATLGEAVRTTGWPTLRETRGKLVFALDNGGLRDPYRAGRPSLEGRVMFTPSAPGEDDAAFAKLNDPIGEADAITAALAANMLVRTRADADTLDARANDTTRRDAAFASGAQLVSTDYPEPDPALSTYVVRVPGGTPVRCNPVTAPPACTPDAVEDPARLRPPA